MNLVHAYLLTGMWAVWLAYWGLASLQVKAPARREAARSRLLHLLPLLFAGWLIAARQVPGVWLNRRFLPWEPWEFWTAALVTALGLLFAAWARAVLGRNWSGTVTIKEDHQLLTTGPYAVVRHPLYTGMIVAFAGSAGALGQWRGVLAVLIVWAAWSRKLRLEERWMEERFGAQYAAYRRRVPALMPFWRTPSG
jgi:protein-S-isoprenylcysteine O-methyltransferase Ste14